MSDILALFVADLNRSLDGLAQSLGRGSSSQGQAALHARDLSDALYGVNLPRHAELASAVSRHLGSGRGGMVEAAQELLRLTRSSLDALNSGQPQPNPANEEALQALAAAVAVFDVREIDFDSAGFRASLDASRQPAQERPEASEQAVFQPASISVSHPNGQEVAALEPASSHAEALDAAQTSVTPQSPQELLRALAQLQAIDHEIAALSHVEAVRQARFRLSDHANWLVSRSQSRLSDLPYAYAQGQAGQLRLDPEILLILRELFSELGPMSALEASDQQMTVFMLMRGLSPNADQVKMIRKAAQSLRGRLEFSPDGVRLVFPSSLHRLRVVPFRRNGQLYAVSWAQLIGGETLKTQAPDAVDLLGPAPKARLQLNLSIADRSQRLYADEIRPFQLANVFTLPDLVVSPPWVAGILIGAEPDAMPWVAPSDF